MTDKIQHRAYMAERYPAHTEAFAKSGGLTLEQYLAGEPITRCIYCSTRQWQACTMECFAMESERP